MNFDKKEIYELIDEAMKKKDRYVSIFIGSTGVTIEIYPMVNDLVLETEGKKI